MNRQTTPQRMFTCTCQRAYFWLCDQGQRGRNQWVQQAPPGGDRPEDYEVCGRAGASQSGKCRGDSSIAEHHRADHFGEYFEPAHVHVVGHRNATAGVSAAEKQLTAAHAQLEQPSQRLRRKTISPLQDAVDKREVLSRSTISSATARASTAAVAGLVPTSPPRNNSCNRRGAVCASGGEPHIGERDRSRFVHTGSRACAIADVEQRRALLEQAVLNSNTPSHRPGHRERE